MREFGRRGRVEPIEVERRQRNRRSNALSMIKDLAQELTDKFDEPVVYDGETFLPTEYRPMETMNSSADRDEVGELYSMINQLKSEMNQMQVTQAPVARPAPAPYQQPAGHNDQELFALLANLKGDINGLKAEQYAAQPEPQPVRSQADNELFNMLADLKGDINTLKSEQNNVPVFQQPKRASADSELFAALAALKGDITSLKAEQTRQQPVPLRPVAQSGESEIFALLADLKGDITNLKAEAATPPPAPKTAESEIFALLANLKGDINVLKAEQVEHVAQPAPAPVASPAESEIFNMLADLKGEISSMKTEQVAPPAPVRNNVDSELFGLLADLKGEISGLRTEQDEMVRRLDTDTQASADLVTETTKVDVKSELADQEFNAVELLLDLCDGVSFFAKELNNSVSSENAAEIRDLLEQLRGQIDELISINADVETLTPFESDEEAYDVEFRAVEESGAAQADDEQDSSPLALAMADAEANAKANLTEKDQCLGDGSCESDCGECVKEWGEEGSDLTADMDPARRHVN